VSASVVSTLRAEVEDFLYHEAALLDEWNVDDWVDLWADDARYIVPTNDNPDGDPDNDLMYIYHDLKLLKGLAVRLKSVRAHREYPWSTTRHVISNVRAHEEDDDTISARAGFMVWRFRNADTDCYVGGYEYVLARTEDGLKIRTKRVLLDAWTLAPMGAISIIL
jgi:p-cumate 2,3-dioxygenase subunit beta